MRIEFARKVRNKMKEMNRKLRTGKNEILLKFKKRDNIEMKRN